MKSVRSCELVRGGGRWEAPAESHRRPSGDLAIEMQLSPAVSLSDMALSSSASHVPRRARQREVTEDAALGAAVVGNEAQQLGAVRVGGRGGSGARAVPLAREIGTTEMSFGTLILLLTITTVVSAGFYHLIHCLGFLWSPRRPKLARSPQSSKTVEDVRSPYEISIERTSLLSCEEDTPISTCNSRITVV
eukprot:scaffold193677_cov32-Tisochrysis_lutea.AAC.1